METGPVPPMVSRAMRRDSESKLPLLLIGFTGMGALFAAAITGIVYFGSQYLDGSQPSTGNSPALASAEPAQAEVVRSQPASGDLKLDAIIATLSTEQLSTVQSMLLEKREQDEPVQQQQQQIATATTEKAPSHGAELARIQEIVDQFSVQGIRKSGQDTRVFLNGKIQKLGDVVDLEAGIRLIGFTSEDLVFEDPQGRRYTKML